MNRTKKNINLIQGDCLIEMDKLIDANTVVDTIICDPPYGVTACSWDSVIPFIDMWARLNKIIKPNGAILIFGSEPFSSALRMSNIKNYKYDWIWVKNQATNHLHAKRMPMRKTENITVFFKKAAWYNPQKTINHSPTNSAIGCSNGTIYHGTNKRVYKGGDTTRMPLNLQYFDCVNNYVKQHPNEKPIKLIEYLIKTHSNKNETILDFTMGSGSTGVACKNLNRKFIGIELNSTYFELAKKRIN